MGSTVLMMVKWLALTACCANPLPNKMAGFTRKVNSTSRRCLRQNPTLKFLELGRSCVLKQYRTKPVVELLWQGIWNYVRQHGLDVMLGCASLEGTDQRFTLRP